MREFGGDARPFSRVCYIDNQVEGVYVFEYYVRKEDRREL